jgi:F-box and WD-40 domain protein CDC4
MLNAPPRPLSAVEYRSTGTQDQPMSGLLSSNAEEKMQAAYTRETEDVVMLDPQPSTAPLQQTGPTFFHDD